MRARVVGALLAVAGLVLAAAPSPAAPSPAARAGDPLSFDVATFNVLGSQHTRGSAEWKSGRARARLTARMVEERGLDLVAFQEVQRGQLRMLQRKLDRHTIWPGEELGGHALRLQIAWRSSRFTLLETGRISTKFDHQRRPVPWVRLLHRRSGRQLYVVDVHNSPRRQEGERDRASAHQVRLVDELRRTRRVVLLLGDLNEKEEAFCTFVGATDLRAANGGSVGDDGSCAPPYPMRIDWIFGAGKLAFSGYAAERDAQVRKASDHALVRAVVTLTQRPARP